MKIGESWQRSLEVVENKAIRIIDQRWLPHQLVYVTLSSEEQAAVAIRDMWTRGAPLLAAVGAYGFCFALREQADDAAMEAAYQRLLATRPTAVNLRWALERMKRVVLPVAPPQRAEAAFKEAARICEEDCAANEAIGNHGLTIIKEIAAKKPTGQAVQILTHCNAGWLATIDWGTALAPIYKAFDAGIPVHVWVDETRPRNQGAALTAWELQNHGVPFTIIADNTGGHLMQHGMVDMVITGADRVTATGDVCNKIGTYLKALAAADNAVPFYAAVPISTFDFTMRDGIREIPIEQRDGREITHIQGVDAAGKMQEICITPPHAAAANYGFDVTPARLVTQYVTEKGIYSAAELPELQKA